MVPLHHPRGGADFFPYYLWILVVVVGLGYGLVVHLARPLRGLRDAVDLHRGRIAAEPAGPGLRVVIDLPTSEAC